MKPPPKKKRKKKHMRHSNMNNSRAGDSKAAQITNILRKERKPKNP